METLRYERVRNAGFGRNCSFEDFLNRFEGVLPDEEITYTVKMRSILRTLPEHWDHFFETVT